MAGDAAGQQGHGAFLHSKSARGPQREHPAGCSCSLFFSSNLLAQTEVMCRGSCSIVKVRSPYETERFDVIMSRNSPPLIPCPLHFPRITEDPKSFCLCSLPLRSILLKFKPGTILLKMTDLLKYHSKKKKQ